MKTLTRLIGLITTLTCLSPQAMASHGSSHANTAAPQTQAIAVKSHDKAATPAASIVKRNVVKMDNTRPTARIIRKTVPTKTTTIQAIDKGIVYYSGELQSGNMPVFDSKKASTSTPNLFNK